MKIQVFSLLLYIFALVFGIFFLQPSFEDFLKLTKGVKLLEDNIAQEKKYFEELKILQKELEKYKEKTDKINFALPDQVNIVSLYKDLQNLSSISGLLFKEISYSVQPFKEKSSESQQGLTFQDNFATEGSLMAQTLQQPSQQQSFAGSEFVPEAPSLKVVQLSFNAEGTYRGLKEFIIRSRMSPRVLNIRNIKISKREDLKNIKILKFEFKLDAYSY